MKKIKGALGWGIFAATLCWSSARAEELHSVSTALDETTLSGFVDTSWFGVSAAAAEPPANDAFANAAVILVGKVSVPTNVSSATVDPGEPVDANESSSVWYKWVVPTTGVARISAWDLPICPDPAATSNTPALSDESIFYPWGGIWSGNSGGVIVTTGPQIPPIFAHQFSAYRGTVLTDLTLVQHGLNLEFNVQAGETIWIALELYNFGGPQIGMIPTDFNLDDTPLPTNDSFSSQLSVHDTAGGTFEGHLLGASRETGEPDLGPDFAGGSVWFHFVAATYGQVGIGSEFDYLPIGVFTGNDLSSLQLVTKNLGSVYFFGEEGKTYHIAIYRGTQNKSGFGLKFIAPTYRLYETTLDQLFPNGSVPHFYGLRGNTLLFYAKSATGWDLVEVEAIVNYATELVIYPTSAVGGQLRVTTIDDTFPAPRADFSTSATGVTANLIGHAGQTCAVSVSTDLMNWSAPQIITLQSLAQTLKKYDRVDGALYYRVVQSLPATNAPLNQLEPPH